MPDETADLYRQQVALYERAELSYRLRARDANEEQRRYLLEVADLYRAEADKLRQII